MNTSKNPIIATAMVMTMTGYTIAPATLFLFLHAFSLFGGLGHRRCFGRAFGRFAIAPRAFSFLVNVGRKKSGLTQLADGFVGRGGFNQSGRFLSARIERYVSETRHDDVNVR